MIHKTVIEETVLKLFVIGIKPTNFLEQVCANTFAGRVDTYFGQADMSDYFGIFLYESQCNVCTV